jgi:hypothetical protein
MARNLQNKVIKKFHGLAVFPTLTTVSPEWAIDCANVMPSGSGGLEKMRVPVVLSSQVTDLIGEGNIANFQNALAVRQVVAFFDTFFYTFALDSYVPTLQSNDALNSGVPSFAQSNNQMFIANEQRMMKWDGSNFQKWGIDKPTVAMLSLTAAPAIADPTPAPVCTFISYPGIGSSPRTYTVSYTWVDAFGGETKESTPATATTASADMMCVVARPASIPTGSTGWNVYVDVGGGTRHRVNGTDIWGVPIPLVTTSIEEAAVADWPSRMVNPAAPGANTTGTGTTMATGRRYRISYGDSLHIGAASDPSESTSSFSGQSLALVVANPTDGRSDRIWLFATVDGGNDFYLDSNPNSVDGSWPLDAGLTTTIVDGATDAQLNTAIVAPLINLPPPVGKYLKKFMGRIFVGGIVGEPQTVAYSGDERIFIGRPEESFPPNNRIRFAIGADEVGGIGSIASGLIVWSINNEMFMLKGAIEDNTQDAPIMFGARLDELPWNVGCYSHLSVVNSPHGVIWHASDNDVKIFNGTGDPETLSDAITPIMRRISEAQRVDTRGVFYCYQEREWYLLLCSLDGSATKNCILVFDLEQTAEKNVGAFPLYVQADAMEIVEDSNGLNHVVIMQDGYAKELVILSETTGGVALTWTKGADTLGAFWRSGYIGTDSSDWIKLFRYGKLIADQPGFSVQVFFVDEDFRNPIVLPINSLQFQGAYFPLNWKSRFASIEIDFPSDDAPCCVSQLEVAYVPVSQR